MARRLKTKIREEKKAKEQAVVMAKTEAQHEDSDSQMENLVRNSNKHSN